MKIKFLDMFFTFFGCLQVIDISKCLHSEREWRDKKFVPATVEEHLKISARSSGCMHAMVLGLVSMGDVAATEAIEWAIADPKIIQAVCIISHFLNDIMSNKVLDNN